MMAMNCAGSRKLMAKAMLLYLHLLAKQSALMKRDARPMGRSARGVRGARLRPNDIVVGMDIVNSEDQTLLVISQKGFGKRTTAGNFPSHKSGGVGIKAAVVTAKTGPIMSVKTVDPDMTDAILISKKGQTIRLSLKTLSCLAEPPKV